MLYENCIEQQRVVALEYAQAPGFSSLIKNSRLRLRSAGLLISFKKLLTITSIQFCLGVMQMTAEYRWELIQDPMQVAESPNVGG